jgi:signal transduction histidine kinase
MTGESHEFRKVRAPRVWWAFVIIVLGFVLANIVSIYEMRNSQAKVRLIAKHAAIDIELVARLSRDLDRKRVLIQDHILENQRKDMDRIEAELARTDTEIAAASRSYEPIGDDANERAVWQQLDREIAGIEPEIIKVIALSRQNLDGPAKATAGAIGERFDRIDEATNQLLDLNHNRANQEASEVRKLQMRAVIVLAALTLIWTLFALLTARWVIGLITERERQMRHAMTQLEERNRELDAFAARVAHDLRGPLTAINLAAAQFRQRAVYEQATGDVLQRAVTRMEAMIQDLLTLSRVGGQAKGMTCEITNVATGAQEDLIPKVDAAGGTLRINVAPSLVSCNKGLLRQVLWNLGENAVKYRRTEVPLRLEIYGHATANSYELVVSDNGSGMTPWVARQAFDPFFRGKDAELMPGTGLGLSVVKRVIDACGGTISVESEPGQGTTFRIHLPLAISKAA